MDICTAGSEPRIPTHLAPGPAVHGAPCGRGACRPGCQGPPRVVLWLGWVWGQTMSPTLATLALHYQRYK